MPHLSAWKPWPRSGQACNCNEKSQCPSIMPMRSHEMINSRSVHWNSHCRHLQQVQLGSHYRTLDLYKHPNCFCDGLTTYLPARSMPKPFKTPREAYELRTLYVRSVEESTTTVVMYVSIWRLRKRPWVVNIAMNDWSSVLLRRRPEDYETA